MLDRAALFEHRLSGGDRALIIVSSSTPGRFDPIRFGRNVSILTIFDKVGKIIL